MDNLSKPDEESVDIAMLGNAVSSSKNLDWHHLLVERYRYPGGEYQMNPFPVHVITVHLGRPMNFFQNRDGLDHSSVFDTGSVAIIPAGLANVCNHDHMADELFIQIEPALLFDLATTTNLDPRRVELINQFNITDASINYIGQSLLAETQSSGLGGRVYFESLLGLLGVHLLRHYTATPLRLSGTVGKLSPAQLARVIDFIHANLDQDISLNDLAGVVHLSEYHFARLFKNTQGVSPHHYLITQRVEAAKILLSNSKLTTVEIAAQVGFADHSHLARHFKRLIGLAPIAYRNSKNIHKGSSIIHN